MDRPKILVLIDWFYPGYKAGGPIQSIRNFVAAMEDAYEIFILSSDRDLGDAGPYSQVNMNEWNAYGKSARVYYTATGRVNIALLKNLVQELKPDFIYLNSLYSFRFAILPLWLKYQGKLTAKLVLAPRGMVQSGAMQFKSAKKKLFIHLINFAGLPQKIFFHATDEQERTDILQYFPSAGTVTVATNFPAMGLHAFVPAAKVPGQLKLVFISRLAPKKNIHYLLELLAQLPDSIQCQAVFRGEFEDGPYQQRCMALAAKLPAHISVAFDGAIANEMIIPFLQQHHIFALPTLGENFGHAIFESLSAGRPVLISDKTPWRNLAVQKAGWDLPLQNPAAFVQVMEGVAAMDQQAMNEWCFGAWNLAKEFTEGSAIKEQYKKLFN